MNSNSYLLRRRSKGLFGSVGEDPLSNVNKALAIAESVGASAKYHSQDLSYSQGWLWYLVSVKMVQDLKLNDVVGLTKTYLNAWKSGKVCCLHENYVPKRLLLSSERLNHHSRIQHSRDRVCGHEKMG